MTRTYFVVPVLVVLVACSSETPATVDLGAVSDSGVHDLGTDQGTSDATVADLGASDAADLDAALSDSGAIDLGPADLGASDLGDDSGASDGGMNPLHMLCTSTGGTVATHLCCSATSDFPDTCGIGACGCAPSSSHDVSYCECPDGECFSTTAGCESLGS